MPVSQRPWSGLQMSLFNVLAKKIFKTLRLLPVNSFHVITSEEEAEQQVVVGWRYYLIKPWCGAKSSPTDFFVSAASNLNSSTNELWNGCSPKLNFSVFIFPRCFRARLAALRTVYVWRKVTFYEAAKSNWTHEVKKMFVMESRSETWEKGLKGPEILDM